MKYVCIIIIISYRRQTVIPCALFLYSPGVILCYAADGA